MPGPSSRPLALAGLMGAAMPLAFAPFNLWWLLPLGYAALFLLWRRATPRRAFLLGFVFGFTQFLLGVYWIVISVYQIGGAPFWLAILLMLGLVAVMALYPALVGFAVTRWFDTSGRWYWLGTLPAMLVLAEWLRGWLFSGFGWLSPGYAQTESWLLGLAPLVGVLGVGWAVFLVAGALAAVARGSRGDRILASGVIGVVGAVGFVTDRVSWTEAGEREISVALAQGATRQEIKWEPAQLLPIMTRYFELTSEALGSDLVVWPEAAIPQYYHNIEDYLTGLESLADIAGTEVMFGILRYDEATELAQNSVFVLGRREQAYAKRHLVPYGEHFPAPAFVLEWLRSKGLAMGDLTPGDRDQPPVSLLGERIAISICYEDVFGAELLDAFPAATLTVNVSNDAWFGDSLAAHQHLQIARMRAAEVRRWQLRSTNTGITAVIDPFGRIEGRLPQFRPGVLRANVTAMHGRTPYIVWGNWAVVMLALLVVASPLVLASRAAERRASPGSVP